jgi:hypothetical protein
VRDVPEEAERALIPRVIPYARCDDAARSSDAPHLAQPRDRVGHEVDDELGERDVELVVLERQLLGRRLLDGHAGVPLARGCHERLGRVGRRDGLRPEPPHQFGRQRAGPAADVERPLSLGDARKVGEERRERLRVPPHEAVVRLGGDVEGHASILAGNDEIAPLQRSPSRTT